MVKITKTLQPKHKETLSPWLKSYVDSAATTPLPLLPKHLAAYPSRWPFGRGDLYHWIPLLNRFDSILEKFCDIYELSKGPQSKEFGNDLLLHHSGDAELNGQSNWRDEMPADFHIPSDGDKHLVEAALKFTRMLLEHCGNRSIYASSSHLNDLLNSTSWTILNAALEVGSELAQRYQASVRRIGNASRHISSALLANHYSIDLDRVQQLSQPFVRTPIASLAESVPTATPSSASKGKERAHGHSSKSLGPMHANDLSSVAFSEGHNWNGWGDIKVTYYPIDHIPDTSKDTNNNGNTESTRFNLPSTPTPLRRSSTMNSPHQSTPKTKTQAEDSSPLGLRTPGFTEDSSTPSHKTFELTQNIVTTTPISDLVARCPADMPPAVKYEAFHRLRVAKALTGSCVEDRQCLLATRLLAITNLAYIHTESIFVDKVLRQDAEEMRRFQLVYQLAEMIHPSTSNHPEFPVWLQSIALALLEAVSNFNARCQDVLSALNANVNHGILLYVIRKAVVGMKMDDSAEEGELATGLDHWRNSLFSLTLHLSMHTRVGPEMVSAGLMEVLVEILKIRSQVAQRHHSMVVAFLDGLIWTYQNAFTAFFNANGLDAVANLVVDTVKMAFSLMESGKGTGPDHRSIAVDYMIPYHQQQTLRWLLKFIHHIMSNSYSYNGNTDRLLRNLADKSDLLSSLKQVIADKESFGSVDWTNSVTILSDFINNDPTSFTVILDSGLIKTYLEAITNQPIPDEVAKDQKTNEAAENEPESPGSSALMADIEDHDDRPHPPTEEMMRVLESKPCAAGILPTSETINVIPHVLNSISLNSAGMKLVVESRAFEKYFEIFLSPAHVKCMESDADLASNVGGNFDELARHHPALRTSISNAVIDLAARVRYMGIQKAQTDGWGAKLLLKDSDGKNISVSCDGTFSEASESAGAHDSSSSQDNDTLMIDAVPGPGDLPRLAPTIRITTKETSENSFTPYIFAMSSFLSAFLNNSVLKNNFADKGGLELLLDICESPSLTASFGDSLASRVLAQVVSQLVESAPARGLPSVLNRAQAAIDLLEPIASKREPIPPIFAPFIAPGFSLPATEAEIPWNAKKGTAMVKALLNAQTFIKIISECFQTSSRSNTLSFYPVNAYDKFLHLVSSIGPLFPGVLAEEAGQLTMVPQSWSSRRSSPLDGFPQPTISGNEAGQTSIPDALGRTESSTDSSNPTEQEQSSSQYQNYEVFRNVLHPMIPTTFPLFQSLGRALLPRRDQHQGDTYPRPRHIEIAKGLANSILKYLRPSVEGKSPTSKDFHYWIIMLHCIHEMLVEHPSTRHSERANPQLIIPVLLAFKELGVVELLSLMLESFASSVRQGGDNQPEDSSKAKVATFGLKKILDLYLILCTGKNIIDTSNYFNLQRQTDRSQTVPHIFQQFVVELRASILPSISKLWDSSLLEKVPEHTAKRLIEILKLISAADHEPSSTPQDKKPFSLLAYTDSRFNWGQVRGLVRDLVNENFDEGLVHEAVFRANGNELQAREYCRAHKSGIGGARNPIPQADADLSALADDRHARTDRPSSQRTTSSDADQMSLDDFNGDHPGDSADRSPEDTEEARAGGASTSHSATVVVPGSIPDAAGNSNKHKHSEFTATKEDLDKQRSDLRQDLIDRCLDVIRTHPECAIEVSELITAMVIRHENADMHVEVCSTVTLALSSLAFDEDEKKKNGKCIASYSHLLALLLQDETFFSNNLDNLQDKVEEFTSFLNIPPLVSGEDLPPWIPYILLVLETLLRHDERPVAAQWKPPKSLDDDVAEPVLRMPDPLVNESQRRELLDFALDLVPRVGKEEVLATSVLRVLVILTRNRVLARHVGEKRNMQRLFLMAKQLAATGADRMKQSKSNSYIMTILRHIVEDEDLVKQIIRAEIKNDFTNITRSQRGQPDISAYLRHMAPLALRAPSLFVEVTNELVEFYKWSPASEHGRQATLCLKSDSRSNTSKEQASASAPEESDVKESTEPADKDMIDAPRPHHESKRPVVENSDGVIHFLLSELINYRDVDDKGLAPLGGEAKTEEEVSDQGSTDAAGPEGTASDVKDKKTGRPVFKSEEHQIFVYRGFLLSCLTELLQSYNRTKVEFINFKRNAPPLPTSTPVKPRSSVLNYLIYDLLCQSSLNGPIDSIAYKKKSATAIHTQRLLVALVGKTRERPVDRDLPKFAYDDEPDLQFVRKFVLDTILKAYERAPNSEESLETRYSRMQSLAELMNQMVGERDREHTGSRNSDPNQVRSQAQLRRLMYEKGYLEKLTASIAEISLNYPGVKRSIKYILRVLRVLTDTAKELSHTNLLPSGSVADSGDDEFGSTSSLSDLEDDREETPDLYRNSSLGMLEPGRDVDESEEEDEDGEDMYGDEYDDEMDYDDEEISDDDQDNISEDSEMGEIEGLPGDPDVVEVIMDGDEDEEDDDDDSEDDDDLDSADMESVESRVEIVDEQGNPMEDDGASDWESDDDVEDEEDEDGDIEADDLDYEAAGQDIDEAHIHTIAPPADLLGNMARALIEGEEYEPDLLDEHYLESGHDDDDEEEDEEDVDDEAFIYDDGFPLDEQPPPMPALGWDSLNAESDRNRLVLLDNNGGNRRRILARMDNRSPFPIGPGFVAGSPGDPLGDFRSFFSRHHRSTGSQNNTEDGVNPLLRRVDQGTESAGRAPHSHSIGVRLPEGLLGGMGRHGADGPMGFLGELMDILPVMGRNGQAFHFHITGPGGTRDARELGLRATRIEQRRDNVVQEPWQAVSFAAQNTLDRYEEEARMLFGGTLVAEAAKLSNMISAILTPAAVEAEKKRMAEEAERKKRAEEERLKRDAEERRIKEAKEAEEKAAREKVEAEEREAAARAASEAAANNEPQASQESGPGPDGGSAMEGIEGDEANDTGPSNTSVPSDQPRVMAILGDQEIDVTDLGIDPDYLAALPEEFREEVIAQAVSARRSEARAEAPAGESTVAFQEFLDALPVQLRREIEQQEAQEQRRRDNGNTHPAASSGGPEIVSGDMDTASILLTFPQELRDQVLLEQGNEIMEHLPPEMAEQARRLQRSNAVPHPIPGHRPVAITRTGQQPPPPAATESKPQRRTVVQMLDKAGVATLVRLMFIAQQGSIRNYLFSVFADVCENRQNRLEVISTILQILQEGSTDMSAVDRSFSHLSLKARRHNRDKDLEQKTPQSVKKSLTALNSTITSQTNSETSPLLIVQQCLDLLVDLCTRNPGIPWLFLTEHETVGSTLRKTLGRKGKSKDTKAHKYAINSLLTLLDRDLVMESSVVMTHLADLLNRVTIPLLALDRRRREAEEEVEEQSASKSADAQADQEPNDPSAAAGQASGESAAPPPPTTAEGGPSTGDDAKTSQKDDSRKKARQIQPPVIPPQNLTLVIRVFVARECSSKTFQNTINTIKNLSTVPGARSVFGQELVRQARLLSENIVTDLDELLPHIEKATSGTEIQGVALSKFSPGASEQNKLLRVLTALDHLFDGKKKSNGGENDKPDSEKQDLVTSLYHNSTFSAMWDKLGACLTAIHERENMFNVATILLPLIESLMVVCKNTTTQDDPSQGQLSKEMVLSSPPPESRTASLFFSFTEDHRRILNELVRNNPKLMSGTFALLVKNPKVLEFDNKRNYFNRSVHSRSGQPHHGRPSYPTLNLSVRRDQVFHDSFKSLYFKSGDEMKFGKLNIRFHGEEGVDAGGVTREWFQVLARQMFDANYALFIPVSSDRTTFHPNKLSGINDEHLMFFKFIGRIIGKALYEGRVLDCYFSRAVYKRILGKSVSVKDMESFDPDYYKSLCWMLENDITDIITETFSVEDDEFGVTKVVDLIPNGREIPVTDENKQDYVRLVVEHKLLSSVKDQMEHFLKGFHDIIPEELISIFNEQELELLISGLPDIDVDDWKSNTEYQNYNPSSPQIQWFWRAVRSFDKEERAKLLQFVTGTSKVPLNGFKELEGMNGVNRFNIHRDYGNKDRLPTSHTCFNQLDIPEYESYDALRSQLMKAITAGSEYFGFA
ncbi:unnamed protein product [Clonostachys solani]|uniref:HECT-type E3 ubiquitin transferase n=1 Tax=Clonostachys solani TaxID=160281 RepID=A0A9N9ZMI2_9HYPO|nr:unnamed protein product [Clonostachys solani]